MKTGTILMCLTLHLLMLSGGNVHSQTVNGQSLRLGLGASYLNQTFEGERLGNLLTQDFSAQLDMRDIGASYRARFHDDAVLWQRATAGLRWKNVEAFYSLNMIPGFNLSGGGLRLEAIQGIGRFLTIQGDLYDRGYSVEGACSVERNGFVGKLGYNYQKIQDFRFWGPNLSLGLQW